MATGTSYICRACRSSKNRLTVRGFATAAPRRAIPPESPYYLDVPETFQAEYYPRKRPRGVLPVPREIFPPQRPDKPTAEYLLRTTPPPSKKMPTASSTRTSERAEYKARSSDLRRRNLHTGLVELYNRKSSMTEAIMRKVRRRRSERASLISQPPREDERLTATSIPSAMMRYDGNVGRDAHSPQIAHDEMAAAIHARRLARTESKSEGRRLSRLDALHTLYMHARSFITTERQLNAEVDLVFDNPEASWRTSVAAGDNIWNLRAPLTVAAMLQDLQNDGSASGEIARSASSKWRHGMGNSEKRRIDQARMKKIAEVLSGGAM